MRRLWATLRRRAWRKYDDELRAWNDCIDHYFLPTSPTEEDESRTCWCVDLEKRDPCGQNPCTTRAYWLDVEDSEIP